MIIAVWLWQMQLPFLHSLDACEFRTRFLEPNGRLVARLAIHVDVHSVIAIRSVPSAIFFAINIRLRPVRQGISDSFADEVRLVAVKNASGVGESGLILR